MEEEVGEGGMIKFVKTNCTIGYVSMLTMGELAKSISNWEEEGWLVKHIVAVKNGTLVTYEKDLEESI